VLRLIAEGYNTASIAEALFISPRTVHYHIWELYKRLGVGNRVAAIRAGIAAGLLAEDALNT